MLRIIAIAALIVVLAIVALWVTMALGADYWTTCEDAYKFCNIRPYHRECVVYTRWKRPLTISRVHTNPAGESRFCKENRWHMMCTDPAVYITEDCPMPEER